MTFAGFYFFDMKKYFILYLIALNVCFSANAQDDTSGTLSGSLEDRFEYVFKKSSRYETYKVISISNFNYLKKSALDSVSFYKQEIEASKAKINDITAKADNLNTELQTAKAEINQLKESLKTTSFFGVNLNKGLFNMIVFGVVSGLVLFLILFVMKFRSAKTESDVAVENLARTEEEYEEYRRKAMEKEQQLGRKLQDEINKNKKDK